METATADVVIVGGGIAGSALAATLAQGGLQVSVLERTRTFPDRVRGEMWNPWGVALLQQLGLCDVLTRAGGYFTTRWAFYDDALPASVSEEIAVDVSAIVPGVPGILNIGHPTACQALFSHALRAGAGVRRGVTDVAIDRSGDRPVVRWTTDDGASGSIVAPLVVGADGRASLVRRQAGIELHSALVRQYMTGLLVEGDRPLASHIDSHGTGRDVNFYSFPQGPATSRVYLAHFDVHRYAGPDGSVRFLADLAQCASPDLQMLSHGRAVSPIATHPSVDTWTDAPYAPGVVLVGDSAGYNDPIIGQGLSLAMADVRDVARAILTDGPTADFTTYGTARADRHAKQRTAAQTFAELMCSFGADMAARRLRALPLLGEHEVIGLLAATVFAGPEVLPPGTAPLEAAQALVLAA